MPNCQPNIKQIFATSRLVVRYRYNGSGYILPGGGAVYASIIPERIDTTAKGIMCGGFRVDKEFVRAKQLSPTSVLKPVLGGVSIPIINTDKSGQLTFQCVHTSDLWVNINEDWEREKTSLQQTERGIGGQYTINGVTYPDEDDFEPAYNLIVLAQMQQNIPGGDLCGATITIDLHGALSYAEDKYYVGLSFIGCTVASVPPFAASVLTASDYEIVFNYLDWDINYGDGHNSMTLHA